MIRSRAAAMRVGTWDAVRIRSLRAGAGPDKETTPTPGSRTKRMVPPSASNRPWESRWLLIQAFKSLASHPAPEPSVKAKAETLGLGALVMTSPLMSRWPRFTFDGSTTIQPPSSLVLVQKGGPSSTKPKPREISKIRMRFEELLMHDIHAHAQSQRSLACIPH